MTRLPILVDVAQAVEWTGRSAGTLRRWVHEGRVTRYGTPRHMLLDLRQLPEKATQDNAPSRQGLDALTSSER